ncbi:LuxR C-terminal-related transcriptional regulator [Siphonobacter sp. SORGH_AS_0500]|uniref:response regulator transcription factor n=1 Tax=Siphonobacter sp. SORGH_AS_0500 TaxID=1864824 RepID=UPI00285DA700|nr:LuxR C-terminal-related transcriptional regulator [Siphonobacter sp. SORGH_AS_0500]MDR6194577.1 DNA-binding CsgD family transcriptional regulator [Siphonobacter sp. SORGH_AS_0500]
MTTSTSSPTLSEREKDVISLLSLGLDSQAIADRLFISKNTVDTHRRNIKAKLGLTGKKNALALYAIRHSNIDNK